MRYNIYQNEILVNTIVCDPNYIDEYCTMCGYTYKELPKLEQVEPDPIPQIPDNETLFVKIQALTDQQSFLEDCIAEMASIVYA